MDDGTVISERVAIFLYFEEINSEHALTDSSPLEKTIVEQ
jgi:glutathione S-transferase